MRRLKQIYKGGERDKRDSFHRFVNKGERRLLLIGGGKYKLVFKDNGGVFGCKILKRYRRNIFC